MKKTIVLIAAYVFGLGVSSFSQESDTSKVRIGSKEFTVIVDGDQEIKIITDDDEHERVIKKRKRKMNGTWEGLEFGLNNFVNADYQMELPDNGDFMGLRLVNSYGVNLNMAEKSLGLIKNYFGIVTGLGFEYNRYMLDNDFSLVEVDGFVTGQDSGHDLYKNRLSIWHLNVPLLAEFQIPVYGEHKRIKVSAGVVGGLRLCSRQVQKYVVDGDKQKLKTRDDFNIRDFRYGLTARVGYGDFGFFANYYPQTLFKDGMGPDIFPVTVGIHLGD